MKKYETYKDSGIEWIGEIPSHWDSVKLKFRGKSIIGIIYSPDDVVNEGEGLLILRSSNIQDGKLAFEDCVFVDKSVPDKHLTKEGDILLCARNGSAHLVGKAAYIDKQNKGVSFGAFMSIVRSDLDKYLYHFFSSQVFKAQTGLFSTSTINQLTSDTLNNMFISFPRDKTEQTAIAHYLDRKTAEIDELIADKKRLLELYEEEKTAIINQAVTKGINPDVPMKDSGIEWLGEIPDHWLATSLKRLVSTKITDGPHETPAFLLEGVPFASAESVKNGKIDFNFIRGYISSEDDEKYSKKCKPKKDDIFIVKSGSTTGKIALVDFDKNFNIWSPLALVRVNQKVNFLFMYYALQSDYFQDSIRLFWSFGTQPNIGMNVIENLKVAFAPDIKEQLEIVHHIEKNCLHIDGQIAKIKKLIDLLSEYRTALISEVVTGKVKVTE